MPIDVRLPIGTLFLVLGVILAGYGVATGVHVTTGQLDFVWGSIMAVFGAVLTWFGSRADARRGRDGSSEPAQ